MWMEEDRRKERGDGEGGERKKIQLDARNVQVAAERRLNGPR